MSNTNVAMLYSKQPGQKIKYSTSVVAVPVMEIDSEAEVNS